jgi:hypothetical protein
VKSIDGLPTAPALLTATGAATDADRNGFAPPLSRAAFAHGSATDDMRTNPRSNKIKIALAQRTSDDVAGVVGYYE